MKVKGLYIVLLFSLICSNSFGQLLQWNTFGNAGTETTEPSVFNDVNVSAANLTQGTITAAANANRFGGSNWFNTGDTPAGSTLAEAIAGNDYIQFIVTPNVGFSFSATSFVFNWDRSGTGPINVALRSSVDAFAANLGAVTPVAAIGTSNTITISGLTGITTATTFRLYGYGATGTGGTGGFDVGSNVVNVQLNGTTASLSPTLTLSTSTLTGFTYVQGSGPSTSQSYNLSGANLTGAPGNITVTGSANYLVSTDNITFLASVSVPYASSTLASTPIYVRLKAGLVAGTYNGETVSNAGGGATTVNVTCGGTVTTPTTVFNVGDIAIVGLCTDMNTCSGSITISEDEISFVSFEDILVGTTIDLTDNGFERLNCGSNTWGNTEGVIRLTRTTSTIPKGTIITIRVIDESIFTMVQPDANWTISYPNTGYGLFNMNSTDEQIYIMQGGTWNKNTSAGHDATYPGGLLMFGINTFSAWTCNNNLTTRGDLPTSLKCFSILPGIATKHIKYTGPTTAATQKDWIDRLNSSSNWTGFATCATYLAAGLDYELPQTFVINAGGFSSGYWTGGLNTDWFDCNNWQNYKVPDSLSNVTVDNVANDPIIGASPALFPNGAVCNNLFITSTFGAGIVTMNNALSHLSIKGNTTNNGTFTATNGLTDFRSANAQSISGSGTTTFYNLRLNNSNTSGITLFKPITTSATLTFLNGILTTTSSNILNMSAGSVASGAYNSSFVNGPLTKTGSTDFIFPVGKDNVYRPISATSLTGSETFTAEYFHADPNGVPYDVTLKDAALDDIGRCEYWILNRAGAVNANVTLSWDTYSCGVTSLPDLSVARWNGTMWKDHGNGGTTGTTTTGTVITSALVTSFSPFTLASTLAGVNPLPIELLSFSANYNSGNVVDLKWSTATETNNDYFTIERSKDGVFFTELNVIDGAGNSTTTLNYSSVDGSPLSNISYYRLKQTDFNGNYSYSQIVSVEKNENHFEIVSAHYTESQNQLTVYFNCNNNCKINFELYDLIGRKIYSCSENRLGENSEIVIPTDKISEGVYLIKAFNGNKLISKKVKL